MQNKDKMVYTIMKETSRPCLHYAEIYEWFIARLITEKAWCDFTARCLGQLMVDNRDVLERLKDGA